MFSLMRTGSRTLFHGVPDSALVPIADACLRNFAIDPTVFNPSLSRFVMSMPDARAPSQSQPQCTVSLPFSLRYSSFTHDRLTFFTQKPDAHNVCSRAKNHYDPQQGQRLFYPDIVTEATTQASAGTSASGGGNEYQRGFQNTHENMARVMY